MFETNNKNLHCDYITSVIETKYVFPTFALMNFVFFQSLLFIENYYNNFLNLDRNILRTFCTKIFLNQGKNRCLDLKGMVHLTSYRYSCTYFLTFLTSNLENYTLRQYNIIRSVCTLSFVTIAIYYFSHQLFRNLLCLCWVWNTNYEWRFNILSINSELHRLAWSAGREEKLRSNENCKFRFLQNLILSKVSEICSLRLLSCNFHHTVFLFTNHILWGFYLQNLEERGDEIHCTWYQISKPSFCNSGDRSYISCHYCSGPHYYRLGCWGIQLVHSLARSCEENDHLYSTSLKPNH